MNFRIFILSVCITTVSFSQVVQFEEKLEGLDANERAYKIIESMSMLTTYDRKRAVEFGEEVLAQWDNVTVSDEDKADFLYKMAVSYISVSKSDTITSLLKVVKGLDRNSFIDGIELTMKGSMEAANGNYEEALELEEKAYQQFTEVENERYKVRVAHAIAYINYETGDYEEGLKWVNDALLIIGKIDFNSMKGSSLTMKGALFTQLGNNDSAKFYLKEALEIQESLGIKSEIARIANQMGILVAREGDYDKAYELFYKAKVAHQKLGNMSSYIQMVNNLGIVHYYRGDYDSAASAYINVIETCEELGDRSNLALGLSNLANVYQQLKQYESAIEKLDRSLVIYEELGIKPGISRVLNNLGNAHRALFNYEKAIDFYKRSIVLKEEMGRKSSMAVTLHNVGDLYRIIKDYENSEDYYRQAISLRKEMNDVQGSAHTYFGLGKLNRNMGNVELVELYLDSAMGKVEEAGILFLARDIYEFKALLYDSLGDYQKAYESHVLYKTIYDSLFTTEKESMYAEISEQYKTKEQQQQIELLEQRRRNQNQLVGGLIGGSILLLVLIGVTYNRYRLKNRANKIIKEKSDELEQSNIELKELSEFKQGLTNMIAHDIKNPLNSIIFLSEKIKDKNGKEISKAGSAILRLITNMLDVEKYQESKPLLKLEKISIQELINEANLSVELLLHDKSIVLKNEISFEASVEVDKEIIVRVLVNLLSNAIKFSPTNDTITLKAESFLIDERTYIRFGIRDNGNGIPEEDQEYIFEKFYQSESKKLAFAASTGLGLTFCKMAMEAHDGDIKVESEVGEGSTFWITLQAATVEGDADLLQTKPSVEISADEQEILRGYSNKLKELKVHNVGAIMPILDEIEELNLDSEWVSKLRSAVKYSNKEQFGELLKMIK